MSEDLKIDKKLVSKAQQEMVGFIIIVIIVAIVGVAFLGMYLRSSGGVSNTDAEISNFLVSSAKITSSCVKGNEPNYRTLGELAEDCFQKKRCLDEREACRVLEDSYKGLLSELWPAGKDRPIGQYKMDFYYREFIQGEEVDSESEYGPKQIFLQLEEGNSTNCVSRRAGTHAINLGSGDIVSELEICKNQ